jgi:hypothetical protein
MRKKRMKNAIVLKKAVAVGEALAVVVAPKS